MDFQSYFIDSKKTILVPPLQRDYVQGEREDVISPFLDALLDLEKSCDLNYIYGYDEGDCFVPVDGQQRLITLWLLYLYVYTRKEHKEVFPTKLKFLSREYAERFCHDLVQNLENTLNRVENRDLGKAIENESWFISSWSENKTVDNMLRTLTYLHQKIKDDQLDAVWEKLTVNRRMVTFSFNNMGQDQGIDDDIYMKMNGRGRLLTPFENLKSWMDGRIGDEKWADEWGPLQNGLMSAKRSLADGDLEECLEYKALRVRAKGVYSCTRPSPNPDNNAVDEVLFNGLKWRIKMDNEWTQLFWKNRDKGQDAPEEIDDEQLCCFYNLLVLYYYDPESPSRLEQLRDNCQKEFKELSEYLQPVRAGTTKDVTERVIDRLMSGEPFSLVWIERLELIPLDFYPRAMEWLDQLCALYLELNELGLYLGGSGSNTSITHRLAMTNSSFARTLPLLYSILAYHKEGVTSLQDWMRTMRNLILNSTISRETFGAVMTTIKSLAGQAKDKDLYEILHGLNGASLRSLSPFSERQVREEVRKSDPSLAPYRKEYFVPLENTPLFQGNIELLLRLMSHEPSDELEEWSAENCRAYTGILMELFGDESKLCTTENEGKSFLLHRALMTYPPYRFGRSYRSVWHSWQFCSTDEEWRGYFNQRESYADLKAFISLVKDIRLDRANGDDATITDLLQMRIASELQKLERVEYDAESDFYRYFFIKTPEVWTRMGRDLCCFWDTSEEEEEENNYSIQLKEHQTARTRYTDIRTLALYEAYTNGDLKKVNKVGWQPGLYPGGGEYSCLYMEKELRGRTVAIDAYYWNHGSRLDSDSSDVPSKGYTLDLFLRPLKEDQSTDECKDENEHFFSDILSTEVLGKLFLNEKHYGRYSARHLYTRDGLEALLQELMSQIDEVSR